ncbi:MAG: MOSC domain-containing protein [Candidatus Promineifilaceae bacterium]|nr:MOSC domain-containing protein [Candidatus Promineifilaceae bacterium]
MNGTVTHLFLKTGHGEPMQPAEQVQAEGGQGLVGDLSHGVKKRQILLVEREVLSDFGLSPGQIKENITVSGLRLRDLAPGARLQVGETELAVYGDCAPCQFIDDIRPGLRAEMEGQRGTLCWVATGGQIRRGDPVRVLP